MVAATAKQVRFTVDEYLKMDRAGLFDNGRVELVMGRIFNMHAQANPHRWSVSKGSRVLQKLFPPEAHWVVVQGTLFLSRHGAPEPDLHVFDVPEGTADVLLPKPFLVIEISDSTYRKDSGIKLRQYASAGIADYWIVNLLERRIEVYRSPRNKTKKSSGWEYADVKHFKPGQKIKLFAYPKISIAVNELLP
jgi:Uma2 family endonuclease